MLTFWLCWVSFGVGNVSATVPLFPKRERSAPEIVILCFACVVFALFGPLNALVLTDLSTGKIRPVWKKKEEPKTCEAWTLHSPGTECDCICAMDHKGPHVCRCGTMWNEED